MKSVPHNKAHEIKPNGNEVKVLKFRAASLNIEIECLYGSHFYEFKPYLKAFQTPDISLRISQEDIDRERLKHPEMKIPDVEVECERVAVTYDFGCLEPFVALYKLAEAVLSFDTFLMHGAVVEKDGYAYMFTAPSGMGKSTRIQLWKEQYPDSIVINGDKPLIKVYSDGVFACGTPWCGKEKWNSNRMAPLHAIFLLERAEKDSIEEISLGKAFPLLLKQSYWPSEPDAMRKTIQLLQAFEGKVKLYKFRSTPTKEAVQLAFETARPR